MTNKRELGLGTRLVGWLWLLTALVMLAILLKAGSGSKPIQWVHASFVFLTGVAGIAAGIATGRGRSWGARVLLFLSWTGVIYFVAWGLAGAFLSALSRLHPLIGVAPLILMGLPAYLFAGFVVTLSLGPQAGARSGGRLSSPG